MHYIGCCLGFWFLKEKTLNLKQQRLKKPLVISTITFLYRYRKLSELAGPELAHQINALLCTPTVTSRPSTTTTATRVLSSAKLTASLKSDSYMGRKILYPGTF